MMTTTILDLDPQTIIFGWRARQDYGDLEGLRQSLHEVGQLQRIVVTPSKNPEKYVLIAGARRVKACEFMGIKVKAEVLSFKDEYHAITAQLHENLKRKDFDQLEVGEGLLRQKQIYEKDHPETKVGSTGGGFGGNGTKTKTDLSESDKSVPRFTLVAAQQTGLSETLVKELIQIANLDPDEKARIKTLETTGDRNKAAQEALRKLRDENKLKALEKKAADNRIVPLTPQPKIELHNMDNGDYFKAVKTPKFDLILTDPPYDRERSLISHVTRASINKSHEWDKLNVGWVLKAAKTLTEGGQLIAPLGWV